ncbi:MAG TPA: tannase/feruloyl esterase family alpha/beta hydrolase [Syntrophorhabdaceae bacterium]|nr:tannase/feruloyl esterase family alpha/beta hydrolase [Syntrophorhabdaceae bacterium]
MRFLEKLVLFVALVVVFIALICADLATAAPDCNGLLHARIHKGSITDTLIVSATGSSPEYCKVTGKLYPEVGFELRLPTTGWNKKLLHVGGGGLCGSIPTNSGNDALNRGYAVVGTDAGHSPYVPLPGGGDDGSWAYDNPQGEVDFAYRAVHIVTVAAKQLVKEFYGRGPKYSYFRGCSTGGRQALMEAHQFAGDFEGIIAGDPHPYFAGYSVVLDGWYDTVNYDAALGQNTLTTDKVEVLRKAVYSTCDDIDGLKDSVIDDPRRCDFDAASITCTAGMDPSTCLTAQQVEVVKKLYDGPKDSRGRYVWFGGLGKGSENVWPNVYVANSGLSIMGKMAQEMLRYMMFRKDPGPSYSLFDFNYDTDLRRLKRASELYNPVSYGHLQEFKRHGGKLLMYTGWADPHNALSTVHYYQEMSKIYGEKRIKEWFRFFPVPGMNHCSGGPGPNRFDMLTALENWVENNVAPDRIIASGGTAAPSAGRTRPLCPYPLVARYTGNGSTDAAENFACVKPDYTIPTYPWEHMRFPWEGARSMK